MPPIHALAQNTLVLASLLAAGPVWAAPQLQLLYAFKGNPDGGEPAVPPTLGPNGVLFGTTVVGGTGFGTVYQLTPPLTAQGNWTETILATLGGRDGAHPLGRITVVGDKLFGTAEGSGRYGGGTVFQLRPPLKGSSVWRFTRLHNFDASIDGRSPYTAVVADGSGALYGSTTRGTAPNHQGAVFRLSSPTTPGSGRSEILLNDWGSFNDLVPDTHGGFYQVDTARGTIYSLTNSISGTWSATGIYTAPSQTSKGQRVYCPIGNPVTNSAGTLFAVLTCDSSGRTAPAIVEFVPPALGGSVWTTQIIYTPQAGIPGIGQQDLVVDTAGALYCATPTGGSSLGTIFRLSPPSAGNTEWRATTLYTFTGESPGLVPTSGMSVDGAGNLFFVTGGDLAEVLELASE